GLQQFDVHVTGKTHGERHVHRRGLATVHRIYAREVIEHEPRADMQLLDPMVNGPLYVLHDVSHLDDPIIRLSEPHLSHTRLRYHKLRGTVTRPRPPIQPRAQSVVYGQ